jgi:hypothetical protein
MPDGDRTAELIELVPIDFADWVFLPAVFPRGEVGCDLDAKRLMHLDQVDVVERQTGSGKESWHRGLPRLR